MSVLLGIWKEQVINLITSFPCGPLPEAYVLARTVSIHEPKALIPTALPPADESVKLMALLEKARAVGTFAKAVLNTAPLANAKD
jgi:hypothetical protein